MKHPVLWISLTTVLAALAFFGLLVHVWIR